MAYIDLGIALDWELDREFVARIDRECQTRGLSSFIVDPHNLEEVWEDEDIRFHAFLDRASDCNSDFEPLVEWLQEDGSFIFNYPSKLARANDKATMHLEFLSAGLQVPYTIILSPYAEQPEPKIQELGALGRSFVVKPALGGGGDGVVIDAQNVIDVARARQEDREDKYLIQEKIVPQYFDDRRAWFRVFYVCGGVLPCWWNDLTHVYEPVTDVEEQNYSLIELRRITNKIAEICQLDFFSSEIAISESNKFVVVDYVNDQCDMRLKSLHPDGVPDEVIDSIVRELVNFVLELKQKSKSHQLDSIDST